MALVGPLTAILDRQADAVRWPSRWRQRTLYRQMRALLVVEPGLQNDEIFAVDEVDEAVFFGDPARPGACEHVPQWFWLAVPSVDQFSSDWSGQLRWPSRL